MSMPFLSSKVLLTALLAAFLSVSTGCGKGGCRGAGKRYATRYKGTVIDAHAHFSYLAFDKLMGILDRHGIHHIINFSGGFPGGILSGNLAMAERSKGRISVMCNIPWRAFPRVPDFVPRVVRMLGRCKKMGVVGLKIEKGLGLYYKDQDGKLLRVDDERLSPIFEEAGRLFLPVAIHVADPKAFWLPNDGKNERHEELDVHPGWSFHGKDVYSWEELQRQFSVLVRRHRKTVFVGVHFGNAAEEPDRVARMLSECPNYYIDTAARIPEFGRHPPRKMHEFFIRFQDRILFGTDLGVGPKRVMLGSSGDEEPGPAEERRFFNASFRYFETWDRSFDHPTPIQGRWKISGIGLPSKVLRKIYCANAVKVYKLGQTCR